MLRLFAALTIALAGCTGDADGPEEDKARPVPVTVIEAGVVGTGDVRDLLVTSASVEAQASADIVPKATGRVASVLRDVGDAVRKGEVLAVLDNVTLDTSREVARAEVDQLQQRLDEVQALYAQGAVSQRDLDDARYSLDTSKARLREASSTASETKLTAPFAGVVASRSIKVGEVVSGAAAAFQVVDLSELRVRAKLPERDVSRVHVGQKATLVAAYDNGSNSGAEVTRISPVIDPTTGTFEVTLVLEKGQSALRPGQYVTVQLEVDRHADVLVVPKNAVVYDNGAPVVFTVAEERVEGTDAPVKVAHRTPVVLGLSDPERSEITAGLSAGDTIVVIGQSNLRDGARVREPGEPAAAGPTTSDEGEEG